MRQVKTKLFIFLCVFIVGSVVAIFWIKYRHDDADNYLDLSALGNIPSTNYCELVNNPNSYDGKVVRVHAHLSNGKHGPYLVSDDCAKSEQIAVIFYPNVPLDVIENLSWKNVELPESVDLIALGRFRKVGGFKKAWRLLVASSDAVEDTAPLLFKIARVEQINKSH